MQGKRWLVLVSFVVAAVAGCRELNRAYCVERSDPEKPESYDPDCANIGDRCGQEQCRAPTSVCNPATTMCVECVKSTDCPSTRPTCSDENTCFECLEDATCMSELCLADRTCAKPEEVAYVDGTSGVDNADCSKLMPCKTLQHALGLPRSPDYIRASGAITSATAVNIENKMVSIFGQPGTTITNTAGGKAPILDIKRSSVVTLVDLEIIATGDGHGVEVKDAPGPTVSMTRVKVSNALENGIQIDMGGKLTMADSQVSNSTLAGINVMSGSLVMTGSTISGNREYGVRAGSGTRVEIRRSLITGTPTTGVAGVHTTDAAMVVIDSSVIAANVGASGGISVAGTGSVSITNSIIASNGIMATTAIGGVTLDSMNVTFEFNTVADNASQNGGIGIDCKKLMEISSSIFSGNLIKDNNCNVTYSLTGTPVPSGVGNKPGAAMFLSTVLSSPMFYRIGPMSDARDSANSDTTVNTDIDGQPRTRPKDMGADEIN